MKRQKKLTMLLALPMICTKMLTLQGCAQNDDEQAMPAIPQITYQLHAKNQDAANTRVSIDEHSYRFRWDAGDQVTVWMGYDMNDALPYTFTTTDGGLGSARFSCTGPQTNTQTCFALYPANGELNGRELKWEVPAQGIVQQAFNQSSHLRHYRAMRSDIGLQEESSPTLPDLRFRQLTGLLIFRLTNQGQLPCTVKAIRIESDRPVFHTTGICEAGSNEAVQLSSAVSTLCLTLGTQGLELPADQQVQTAYLPILPTGDLQEATLSVVLELSSGELTTLSLKGQDIGDADGNGLADFAASYYYLFNLNVEENNLIWDMDKITGWEEGETIEIPVRSPI